MKRQVSELDGADLDYAVAIALVYTANFGVNNVTNKRICLIEVDGGVIGTNDFWFSPSTSWRDGGEIIEREKIGLAFFQNVWAAYITDDPSPDAGNGPTPLIAAMRCFVMNKLGNEVDIPDA